MMYACRNRSKAIRRWLPLNRSARDIVAKSDGGHNAGEDRICCGGAPARRGGLAQTRRRSRAERREDHGVQASATISAQRNPASSRAMAAATTERTFLWAANCRNRLDRRTCAAHGFGWHTYLALSDAGADVRTVLVGPGRFAELAPQVSVSGPGDGAAALGEPGRVLPGHQAGETHEWSRLGEAAPVEDLGGETQRTDSGHAPVGGQTLHLIAERVLFAPGQKIGLDRFERGVAQLHRGQVVRVGSRDGRVVEGKCGEPAPVTFGPR